MLRLVPALCALTACALPAQEPKPAPKPSDKGGVTLGKGRHTYRWVDGWAQRPTGKDIGNTHGCVAVDKKGHIYFNTDTADAVMVFDRSGKFVRSWGKEFAGGLHGMTIVTETTLVDGKAVQQEFAYLAHTARHEVAKATLDGEILWTLGCPMESGHYQKKEQFRPTGIAVAPDGRIFVADGYGQSWVHRYDKDRNYLGSFGGRGKEKEKMRTPHGLWLDTRDGREELIVCDRENHRLKWYDLDGKLLRVVDQGLRRPCNAYPSGEDLVVADLAGRVTVLAKDGSVFAQLGDNPDPKKRARNGIARGEWRPGEFLSPHGIACDSHGDLYVLDWNRHGRVTRLERRKAR